MVKTNIKRLIVFLLVLTFVFTILPINQIAYAEVITVAAVGGAIALTALALGATYLFDEGTSATSINEWWTDKTEGQIQAGSLPPLIDPQDLFITGGILYIAHEIWDSIQESSTTILESTGADYDTPGYVTTYGPYVIGRRYEDIETDRFETNSFNITGTTSSSTYYETTYYDTGVLKTRTGYVNGIDPLYKGYALDVITYPGGTNTYSISAILEVTYGGNRIIRKALVDGAANLPIQQTEIGLENYQDDVDVPEGYYYAITSPVINNFTTINDLEDIYDYLVDNDVIATGEVVADPAPVDPYPTPAPENPPYPDPGTDVGSMPWESLIGWITNIFNRLTSIFQNTNELVDNSSSIDSQLDEANDNLDMIHAEEFYQGQLQEDILTQTENIATDVDSISTQTATQTGVLQNIYTIVSGAIRQALDSISTGISSLVDAVADIIESIENADVDFFRDIVNALWEPFLPILNTFKSAVGIWQYVVQWVQNISAPFSFFMNILSSSNSIYMSPFYAVAAASIVLAIYRRFGR